MEQFFYVRRYDDEAVPKYKSSVISIFIFTWAHISTFHSRFFSPRSSSKKELRSSWGADVILFGNQV